MKIYNMFVGNWKNNTGKISNYGKLATLFQKQSF